MDTTNLPFFQFLDNGNAQLILLCLAVFRIYLEVIGFDFGKLPLNQYALKKWNHQGPKQFHKWGFYFSLGYFFLFAPSFLLS